MEIPEAYDPLTINLLAAVKRQGIDRSDHFRYISRLWKESFVWTPWADRMLDALCEYRYLAIAGCGSSGKSGMMALWAIMNFLCSPANTLVLITTTSLKDSDQRIWGDVKRLWSKLPDGLQCLGKMVSSHRCLRYRDPYTEMDDEKAGIYVVAGAKLSQQEASEKFIGKKNLRVILIADELPYLSEAMMEAAYTNLTLNPYFQCVGLGNPKSYFDAFGELAKPKDGWQSINVEDDGWKTTMGYCLHFDGTKSPNIGHDTPVYPFLFKQSDLEDAIKRYGSDKSPAFWQMVRGFWCPTGEVDNIYCEADIIKHKCEEPVVWASPPQTIGGLDPAFTNGGDDSRFTRILFGINALTLLPTICFHRSDMLTADVTDTNNPHAYQIIAKAKAISEREKINPKYCGYDSTGGGEPFGAIVHREWSKEVLAVCFAGAASDLPVAAYDPTPAYERYADRVTELWYGAQEYMRSGQIKGLPKDLIKEMCERKYTNVKRNGKVVPEAESKTDMKLRTKRSPDYSDSFFIAISVCRERLSLGNVAKPDAPRKEPKDYGAERRNKNVISGKFLVRK